MGGDAEAVEELLRLVSRLGLSFAAVFASCTAVLAVWRAPLQLVYSAAVERLGAEVISGGVSSPLAAFLYVSLLYSFVVWVPVASVIAYRWLTDPEDPALIYPGERRVAAAYLLAVNAVCLASLPLAATVFYPAFIRVGTALAALVGASPVFTVDAVTATFVMSYVLTAATLSTGLVLDTAIRFFPPARKILRSSYRDRALWYAPLYFLLAALTPGDAVYSTLLYFAISVASVELVIRMHRRRRRY